MRSGPAPHRLRALAERVGFVLLAQDEGEPAFLALRASAHRRWVRTPPRGFGAVIAHYGRALREHESNGGEGGIRTHGSLARSTVFETAPFDHSGTSPRVNRLSGPTGERGLYMSAARLGSAGHLQGVSDPRSILVLRGGRRVRALCIGRAPNLVRPGREQR